MPGGSDGKESTCNAGDPGSVPRLGKSPGEGNDLPTPVFLPGEFHGERSLPSYRAWDCKQSDMTEEIALCFKLSDILVIKHYIPYIYHSVYIYIYIYTIILSILYIYIYYSILRSVSRR